MKITLIRVEVEDLKIVRSQGINKLISDNPELEGTKISDRFLFKRMTKWFVKD